MRSRLGPAALAASPLLVCLAAAADAQTNAPSLTAPNTMQPMAMMDDAIFVHGVLDQAEGRWNGRNTAFRYDGQAWAGTDENKIWVKSEGLASANGRFIDGQHEILYDRAISSYFDLQAGVRVDLDNDVTRTWAAFGVEGLSLYFFDVEATGYVSDRGRFAGRLQAYYDVPITQRLILQPQVELNLYSKADPARTVGSGVSDIDTGLRLRYELSRKFAPYIGVAYGGRFFQAASFANRQYEKPNDLRFVFGVNTWF